MRIRRPQERETDSSATIRVAHADDAGQLLALYAPVVQESIISFEIEPPDLEEMKRRIEVASEEFPWLVCEQGGRVLGFAYARSHRERPAYQWSVDVSVFVDLGERRRGVATSLYTSMFRILELQGYCNAYAGIALPNPASERLHEKMGFQLVGIYRAVGYKLGAWRDVAWWYKQLGNRPVTPKPPTGLSRIRNFRALENALAAGLRYLRK